MSDATRWTGDLPQVCDLATHMPNAKLDHGDVTTEGFVDGATVWGPWACMCIPCHDVFGRGLGTGLGQRYDATGLKVEG